MFVCVFLRVRDHKLTGGSGPQSCEAAFGAQLMVSHILGKYEGFHLKVTLSNQERKLYRVLEKLSNMLLI